MVRLLVVGSKTRMFLGPARGTAETPASLTHSCYQQTGQHVGTFICLVTSNKWKRVTTSVLVVVLPQQPHPSPRLRSHRVALTCFARVADGGALPIGVESRHTDGIGSIRNQVVQEGVANISWNQNLFEKKRSVLI